jgi:hypothetical protein
LSQLGHHAGKHTQTEESTILDLCRAFEASSLTLAHRLQDFPRHVRRQDIARFLTKYEIFKRNLPANGSVVECGVFAGGGIATWLHLSSILEPYNHTRRIIGFDTFSGFPRVDERDVGGSTSEHLHAGAFGTSASMEEEIRCLVEIHDRNRPLGHVPKVDLVKGDACQTIPRYLDQHPHLIVSLLYLDFDIYEPTKVALQYLYPRVVKGGIIAFDELNCPDFPGETRALLESLDLSFVQLRRLPLDPYISYCVK